MDRFSEQSAADLHRSFRSFVNRDRLFSDDDGIVDGRYEPVIHDEPEDYETPPEPLCVVARRIAEDGYGTVSQYREALESHKQICTFCRAKKSPKSEPAKDGGKAAA